MVREIDASKHNKNPWNAAIKKVGGKKAGGPRTPLAKRRAARKAVVQAGSKARGFAQRHVRGFYPKSAPYNPGNFAAPKPKKAATPKFLRKYLKNKTVAVVGNSFTPRDISEEVDGHDIVIRFNLDRRRLGWGYTSIRPPVPAGVKVNVMSAYWSNMKVPRIVKNFPSLELLMSVRPGIMAKYRETFINAGLYNVNIPVYDPPVSMYKEVARHCGDPVLTGMSAINILCNHNTAKEINIYNFNFFIPELNPNNRDVKKVYMRYLHGKKGDRRYGSKKRPHRLTRSYVWLKSILGDTPNMTWRATDEEFDIMDKYLL